MGRKLIIFTDCGDTIIDESTQVFDENQIVTSAEPILDAIDVLRELRESGYTIALVADGEVDSFHNLMRQHKITDCFDAEVISEAVGIQKPAPIMFETAMEKLNLTDEDKKRVVMIGNNLKKDIAGANRFGITSIWLSWSPRYFHTVEEADWQPDYTIATPKELVALLNRLDQELA